jgi:hypothetical protein
VTAAQQERRLATREGPDVDVAAARVFDEEQRPAIRRPALGEGVGRALEEACRLSGPVRTPSVEALMLAAILICDECAVRAPDRSRAVFREQSLRAALQVVDPYAFVGAFDHGYGGLPSIRGEAARVLADRPRVTGNRCEVPGPVHPHELGPADALGRQVDDRAVVGHGDRGIAAFVVLDALDQGDRLT